MKLLKDPVVFAALVAFIWGAAIGYVVGCITVAL